MSARLQTQRVVKARAKRACTTCNSRRVRCNVVEKQPCDNCRAAGAHCEIGASRRGKYPRYIVTPHPNAIPGLRSEGAVGPSSLTSDLTSHDDLAIKRDLLSPDSHNGDARRPSFTAGHAQVKAELDRTIFLGESSPLTCVIEEGHKSPEAGNSGHARKKIRWQYPIPEVVCHRSVSFSLFASRRARKIEQLTREGAFDFPEPAVCEMLLQAYFERFHPCFPIVDRVDISTSCNDKTISPLLLQSMLFIGASLCSDRALREAGFHGRYETKFLFYDRGKEIFDADCETNSLSKLQAVFLLSFWRSTPGHEKDTRYWLGAAISLAQTGGIHMLSKLSLLSPKERRIRKRIFWSLYIRDQQVAVAYGLPPRIREEDCDIPMLDVADFDEEGSIENTAVFGMREPEHASYIIHMARLARLLREVVWAAYLPGKLRYEQSKRDRLKERLKQWEAELPPELTLQKAPEKGTMYFAGIVNITYQYLHILLYRPSYLDPSDELKKQEGKLALDAACRCTRILEDMLSQNLIEHGMVHLITNIFAALCIHTVHFSRSEGTERKLAEHRAKLCLLGLKELQKSWDLNYWVLEIFFHCLDESTAEYLQLSEEKNITSTTTTSTIDESNPPRLFLRNHTQVFPNTTTPAPTVLSSAVEQENNLSLGDGPHLPAWSENIAQQQPLWPANNGDVDDMPIEDLSEPFLFEEEFARNFGSCTPRLDSLNSSNLDFLYRYL